MTFATRSNSNKFSRALARRNPSRSPKSASTAPTEKSVVGVNAILLNKVRTLAKTMEDMKLSALVHQQDFVYYTSVINRPFTSVQLSSLIVLMEKIIRDTPRKS